MTTIFPLLILILCITGAIISVHNWNTRCQAARSKFLTTQAKPVEGLRRLGNEH